jgi:hypothetical protein
VAPPLPFPAFKVSAKNGLFLGQISHFLRLRTLAAAAFFWLLYFLLLKKE